VTATRTERGKGPRPSVSVVVPTVGRIKAVERLLAALRRQTLPPDAFETIVVVNGGAWQRPLPSPDPVSSVSILRRREAGRAGACNAGVGTARGSLVVFLDDDMEPVPGCLEAHLRAHDEGATRLVLGPVPVVEAESSGTGARYVAARFERHLRKLASNGYGPEPSDVYTGNASIKRDTLLAIGGFDERLVEYGNEDRELARRLVRAGTEIVMAPDAVAHQHYEKSLAELLADSRSKGRSAATIVVEDPAAITDTLMRRRGSWRRRALRVVLMRLASGPAGRRVEVSLVDALVRARPASALGLVGPLVDSEFWRGVAEVGAGDRVRRILVVHIIDSADFGGAEQVLLHLVAGLDRRAWRSVVIHDPRAERLGRRLAELGIEAVATNLGRARPWLRVPAVARTMRRLRPDIVHVHRPWPRSGRAALLAATLARPGAIIVTDHLAPRNAGRKRRLAERLLSARVTAWIAVSPDIARALEQLLRGSGNRIRTVLNGVAVDRAPSDESVHPPKPTRTTRRLVMLAQLRPQKGHETLLEALAALPDDVTLVLAGDGPERARIEARVADLGLGPRVHLAGFVDDIRGLLTGADVVVLPSRFEGLPLAVLEAMAVGRPIVATDVAGTNELVTDGETGLLVPPDDPSGLATAILRLLDDPDLARRLGENGRERVTERFGLDRMVRGVEGVYREALSSGRSLPVGNPVARRSSPSGEGVGERALTFEQRLDTVLRPIDLRVLSGTPAPARAAALGRHAAELTEALAVVAGSVVSHAEMPAESPGQASSASCDLVVIGGADTNDLALADRLLAPEGTALLLLQSPGGGSGRRRRRLAAAGLEFIGEFRAWPDRRRPQAWIPIERPATVNYIVEVGLGRNPVRRAVRRARAAMWLATGRIGLGSSAVLAGRSGDGRRAMPAVPVAAFPGGTGLDWVLLTGGRRSHNRIVALAFPPDANSPTVVATCGRVAESVPGLRREAAALRAVRALGPDGIPGVPVLLLEHGEGLATTVLQTAIGGTRLSRLQTRDRFAELAELLGDWLAHLVRTNDDRAPEAALPDVIGPLIDEFEARFGDAEPSLPDRLRDALADLGRLPRAIEHRDFAPWNLRLLPNGDLGVLDWESAELQGIAGPDLHYGLAHLAFDAAGTRRIEDQIATYHALLDPRSAFGTVATQVTRRYAARTALEPETLRRLALVAWLIHAQSEYRRMAGDLGGSPGPEVLRRTLFVGLIRADLEALAGSR